MKDIAKAFMVLIILGIVLSAVYSKFARADGTNLAPVEGWFPTGANIYLDVTTGKGIYCHDASNHVSHLGAEIPVWRSGRHSFRGLWVHNSCAEEEVDKNTRDVIGVGYSYTLW